MSRKVSREVRETVRSGLKAWSGGAIVLLLLLTPLLNHQISKFQTTSGQQIFSSSGQRSLACVDPSWELKFSEEAAQVLKDELTRGSLRGVASVGRKPSLYDRLAFGVLEGKYQFALEDGRIREINLVDGSSTGPMVIRDHASFLNEFKELFSIDYTSTQQRTEFVDRSFNVVVFDLVGSGDQRLGQVSFTQDLDGGLRRIQLKR